MKQVLEDHIQRQALLTCENVITLYVWELFKAALRA